jgi:hypothetical protein
VTIYVAVCRTCCKAFLSLTKPERVPRHEHPFDQHTCTGTDNVAMPQAFKVTRQDGRLEVDEVRR